MKFDLQARALQFRSVPNHDVLNVAMRKSPVQLALKTYALASDSEILAKIPGGGETMQRIAEMVDLTEAPEDAICSLVIDLLRYCEKENVDWTQDVMSRARKRFRTLA